MLTLTRLKIITSNKLASVKPKKHLGQHFLKDENIALKIVESLDGKGLPVVEVGPGTGVLTKYLVNEYTEFVDLFVSLFEKGKVTGEEQLEGRLKATSMNIQRTKKWDKIARLKSETEDILKGIEQPLTWLVITEGWCGDSAQNLPFINKMAEASDNIDLRIILRDENPLIMNQFLTNGTKSIPKLICLNSKNEVLWTWGPRPEGIVEMIKDFKAKNPKSTTEEFHRNLHLWYGKDRGNLIQDDFINLLKK